MKGVYELFGLIYRYGSFDAYFIPNVLTGKTRRPRRGIPAIAIKISIMSFPSIARLLLNTKKGFQQKPKAESPELSMVDDRRIELLTSSVSRKRSTSELIVRDLTGRNSTVESLFCQHPAPQIVIAC